MENNLNFTDSNASSGISILKNSAPQTSSSVLENKLHELDEAILGLDKVASELGDKLSIALRPREPNADKAGINETTPASELIYNIAAKTERVYQIRGFLADLLNRAEL